MAKAKPTKVKAAKAKAAVAKAKPAKVKPAKAAKAKTKTKPVKATTKPAKAKAKAKPAKHATPARAAHAERFDRGAYEVPVMDLGEAIALATSLLGSTLVPSTGAIAEEVAHLTSARYRAAAILDAQGPEPSSSFDARAYDVAMDRAWATFVRRIHDHIAIPAARRAGGADAAKVHSIVRDLSILKLNYLAEFAQIGARLDSLKREGLLETAGALAGTMFLDEVLRCHGEYGQALGVMAAAESNEHSAADRGEARLALIEAIAEYAAQVMGQARAGRHDSWEAVHAALKPIADLRAVHEKTHHAPDAPRPRAPHPPVERADQKPAEATS